MALDGAVDWTWMFGDRRMLVRQKLILAILQQAGRPVSKLELVKWAFVLSRETPTRGGSSFYEFLPYHFGPYSFSLQRELDSLVEAKLVEATDKTWACTSLEPNADMPINLNRDVRRIVSRFRNWSSGDVIDYVYRTYPAYTVNSKREKLAIRPCAAPAVYTSGYEGLQIDGFLDRLVQKGIYRLLDVRNNPIARRYGFHKSTLNRLCGLLGIEYAHIPELGIASAQRQALDTLADCNVLFDSYERQTLTAQTAVVDQVGKLMQQKSGVLVCREAEACRCHRSRLASEVARRTGLPVVHLEGAP